MMKQNKNTKQNMFSKSSGKSEDLTARIQKKAYELYVKRGYSHGNDWSDWFEAERLVKSGRG
ncbi:MAG: DUF2934 domain-containing protein [Candidatus Omnitrophica bacterium]|nr:DUF2934 domain-containing protein [Candidatus Omnitrophota bacterium]MDD5352833.1 DUF2934 domain-containing protein [Candidatus Omnitrophota bacterium]MDD5550432.1 DUF2934 domain-containing protein [Candidatus Omnitrophota bacterium]